MNIYMNMYVFAQNPSNVKFPCWLIRSTNIHIKVPLIPELSLVYRVLSRESFLTGSLGLTQWITDLLLVNQL